MNAIVTGATKGIGRALVFGLLKEGWNVAVTSRHEEELKALQAEAHNFHPKQQCLIHEVDFYSKRTPCSTPGP